MPDRFTLKDHFYESRLILNRGIVLLVIGLKKLFPVDSRCQVSHLTTTDKHQFGQLLVTIITRPPATLQAPGRF